MNAFVSKNNAVCRKILSCLLQQPSGEFTKVVVESVIMRICKEEGMKSFSVGARYQTMITRGFLMELILPQFKRRIYVTQAGKVFTNSFDLKPLKPP